MGPLHILALLGCAEWLFIFRMWVSFRYLLLYGGIGGVRLFYLMNLFPHWEYNYLLSWAFLVAAAWHIRALWRGTASHYQALHETPATGIPWLILIARNQKRAFALECFIIVLFIYFMADSRILYTWGFLTLPPAMQAWLASPPNHLIFMWGYALWAPFSYALWNLAVSGVPLWAARKAPEVKTVHYVRRPDHAPTPLPSVKELSDDLGDASL